MAEPSWHTLLVWINLYLGISLKWRGYVNMSPCPNWMPSSLIQKIAMCCICHCAHAAWCVEQKWYSQMAQEGVGLPLQGESFFFFFFGYAIYSLLWYRTTDCLAIPIPTWCSREIWSFPFTWTWCFCHIQLLLMWWYLHSLSYCWIFYF